ncbi:MAG: hypothetical protein OWQ54_09495 [Sulfolobaceae archaeon]|nr:hypothetical protein [Sulfolobaceae archaeon]
MFSLDFVALTEDPLRIKDFFKLADTILTDLCQPIKIGASLLCAVSNDVLLTIYTDMQSKNLTLKIRVEGEDAVKLVNTISRIYEKLKENGFHMTLATSSITL